MSIVCGLQYIPPMEIRKHENGDLLKKRELKTPTASKGVNNCRNFYTSHLWRIENFSQYYGSDCVDLKTPKIMFGSSEWELNFLVNKDPREDELLISIRLNKRKCTTTFYRTEKWRMFFVGKNGCKRLIQKDEIENYKGICLDVFYLREHSLQCKSFEDLLHNDSLTICFELMSQHMFLCSFIVKRSLGINWPDSPPCLTELSNDFLSMMNDGFMADIVLNVDGFKFNAHKFILSVRSKRFSSMFKEMTEKSKREIDIVDIDAQDMHNLLTYIYSGKVSNLPDDRLLRLYVAAGAYDVPTLKSRCRDLITTRLNGGNLWSVLYFSEKYSDKELNLSLKSYLVLNDWLLKLGQWERYALERPKSAQDILDFIRKQNARTCPKI